MYEITVYAYFIFTLSFRYSQYCPYTRLRLLRSQCNYFSIDKITTRGNILNPPLFTFSSVTFASPFISIRSLRLSSPIFVFTSLLIPCFEKYTPLFRNSIIIDVYFIGYKRSASTYPYHICLYFFFIATCNLGIPSVNALS